LSYRVLVKNLTSKNQIGLTLLEDLSDPRPTFADWLNFELAEADSIRPFRVAQNRPQKCHSAFANSKFNQFRKRRARIGQNLQAASGRFDFWR